MDLLARVRHFVARHRLFDRDARVVIAVSGGSDSVALAHLLHELDASGDLHVAGVAHFNHRLRPTADRDERLVVALAESFGWPVVVEREDVAARARSERRSIEDAARTARHEFFERGRTTLTGDVVALGHTRDDQAETFLLRLLRGAGPKGLAAMHPRRGAVVRPLLACRRRELQEYLASRAVAYVDDETNADVNIPRNRVRAELLPLLERRFNPAVVDVLADEAELAREAWLWMEQERLKFEVPSSGVRLESSALDVAALASAPAALRRFVLWRAMCEKAGRRPVTFDHVEAALELLGSDEPRSLDFPGHTVERLGGSLVLRRREQAGRRRGRDEDQNFFDYPLSIPGEVPLPKSGCVLGAEPGPPDLDLRTLRSDVNIAAVRRDLCLGPLRVRNRRPGDRFRPAGVPGRKKLQDYFVDRKVARRERDAVPLVVDEQDRIVWVAGFGIDESFRVTDPAQAVIILRLKLLGGPA